MTASLPFIDLDSSATTSVSPRVLARMLPFFREEYGNPSSPYALGERAKTAVNEARESVAAFLGVKTQEILFTSGGTESNQTAVHSALLSRPDRKTVVMSAVEHSSIHSLIPSLEKAGYRVVTIPVGPDGRIATEDVERSVGPETALVCVMWVNNETGAIAPVGEIARIAHSAGALFHCDGVAAAGKIPVDLSRVEPDSFSLSAHKIHGPKGIGVLFIRKGESFHPLMPGSQERKRRGGTENVPGIVGLGEAVVETREFLATGMGQIRELRDRLEQGIFAIWPEAKRNGPEDPYHRAPHITNLRFTGIAGERLLLALGREGILVSMGSACSSGSIDPSHVLLAMGQSREEALSALRFSLGRRTTQEGVDQTLKVLAALLETAVEKVS